MYKILIILIFLIPNISFALNKDELREELKYWKSLLDDELISQEDYEQKKEELLNIEPKTNENINEIDSSQSIKSSNEEELVINEKNLNESNNIIAEYKGYDLSETDIINIQEAFLSLGFNINVDGLYGNETKSILDYWMNCSNFSKFNAKTYDDLMNGLGCNSDNKKNIIANFKVSHITYEPITVFEKPGINKLYEIPTKTPLMILGVEDNFHFIKLKDGSTGYIGEQGSPIIEISNSLSDSFNFSNFDAVINTASLLCEYPSTNCENDSWSRKKIFRGEFLNILNEFGYGEYQIKVKHESGFIGYIYKYDMEIFNPENHKRVIQTKNNTNNNQSYNSTPSRRDPCVGNKVSAWRWSVSTGYKSCREFDNAVQKMSDTKLCMEAEDEFFDRIKEAYLEEARYRKITCVGGVAYDSNNSNTNSIVRENQLEEKLEKKMECTAKRTEWKTLCKTGDYRIVNGAYCSQYWIDAVHC